MRAVRADVLELVFAAAAVVVFGSAAAAVVDRVSRRTLLVLTGAVSVAALGGWIVFALGPSRELAVAAGGLTVCAGLEAATLVLQRLLARARRLDDQLQVAEARFDTVVSAEAEA